ncbi:MAG: hypothetical protein CYG60_18965 [Actinobacteria bacterium]|nr:MAG: hypothetical protein CYG60_18965 [Actinomycetota bacterium]
MKRLEVYALQDPRSGDFFYVGVSKDAQLRLKQHLSLNGGGSRGLKLRLREMMDKGVSPILTVLETVDETRALERENYHIDRLNTEGEPLVNIQKSKPGKVAKFKDALTETERRRMTLAALSGVPVLQLAKEYGVARSWIYALVEEAKADPVGAIQKAEWELEYRRRVVELLGER